MHCLYTGQIHLTDQIQFTKKGEHINIADQASQWSKIVGKIVAKAYREKEWGGDYKFDALE